MEKKPGSSSWPAPSKGLGDHTTDALVVFGILVSLVFIGGSALLNFRMGYGSASNSTDGTIYGTLAAAGDGLKALSPFVAAYGWKHRQWLAVLAAGIVFLIFTAYSFTSSLGFSSQHRAEKEGNAAAAIERHADTRNAVARAHARLDALGPQRSSAEVKQEIANQLAAPVGFGRWTVDQVSEGCARNKPLTREVCTQIANLKAEQLRAEEAERLNSELKSLTASSGPTAVVTTADAQTDALAYLGRLLHLMPESDKGTANHTGEGLALLMAIFIELGSGLGLYVATTPWRVRSSFAAREMLSPPLPALSFGGPPLETFAAECLHMKPGHELQLATAFEAYRDWCVKRNRSILSRARFMRGLVRLAKELGLDADGTSLIVRDIALRKLAR